MLRTTAEVRRFEKHMNTAERERYFIHKERTEVTFSQGMKARRDELRARMRHMSPYGRDIAETAMRENDATPSVDTRFDPQFHIECFSQDSSNREAQNDRDLARRK